MTAYDMLNSSHFALAKIASSLTFSNIFKGLLRDALDWKARNYLFLCIWRQPNTHSQMCLNKTKEMLKQVKEVFKYMN